MVVYKYILYNMCFVSVVDSLDPYQAAFVDWMILRSTGLRDLPDGPGLAMGSESWLCCPSLGPLGARAMSRGRDRENMTPKFISIPSLSTHTYMHMHMHMKVNTCACVCTHICTCMCLPAHVSRCVNPHSFLVHLPPVHVLLLALFICLQPGQT